MTNLDYYASYIVCRINIYFQDWHKVKIKKLCKTRFLRSLIKNVNSEVQKIFIINIFKCGILQFDSSFIFKHVKKNSEIFNDGWQWTLLDFTGVTQHTWKSNRIYLNVPLKPQNPNFELLDMKVALFCKIFKKRILHIQIYRFHYICRN